ncbi:DeoR family transcriptional regulator [Phyllobacterium myrsinacearum]|jgi:DeoR/GlpR family transcriptional regulator of sugar metabolism|nr:DeoR family transcriptional regulator [Phyllobacterium myrsinacearum]RZS79911.1 DeoR family transcriptional regulator [Phyllobacterium myrsinacearum]RZV05293.1 DeoR family transcriptional regulator [Phyllobacterium myrsinacearum]
MLIPMKIDRAQAIRQFLFSNGSSSIGAIALAVGTSIPTLRRDLIELEEQGVVVRTHGGARLADQFEVEVAFEQREAQALTAKRAIGDLAHDMLRPGSSVFLDSGTTVLQLARRIRVNPMPLNVFTNCLPAAQMLIDVPEVKVTLLGGQLRKENSSVVGPLAEDMLGRLWFNQLFLGAGAIADDGAMSSIDENEARLNSVMVSRAENRILLADSGKFGSRLTYQVALLTDVQSVVTDAALPKEWVERIQTMRVDLRLAKPANGAAAG